MNNPSEYLLTGAARLALARKLGFSRLFFVISASAEMTGRGKYTETPGMGRQVVIGLVVGGWDGDIADMVWLWRGDCRQRRGDRDEGIDRAAVTGMLQVHGDLQCGKGGDLDGEALGQQTLSVRSSR